MPGHLTHIYIARRVADLLENSETKSFDVAGARSQRSGTATGPLRAGTLY
jgi:hypothetical protein